MHFWDSFFHWGRWDYPCIHREYFFSVNFRNPNHRAIPVYTGNTRGIIGDCFFGEDHPRIHGEHCLSSQAAAKGAGPSPYTRGTHYRLGVWRELDGTIPVYTGNTLKKCWYIGIFVLRFASIYSLLPPWRVNQASGKFGIFKQLIDHLTDAL